MSCLCYVLACVGIFYNIRCRPSQNSVPTSECILEPDGMVLVHIPTINYNNSTIVRQKILFYVSNFDFFSPFRIAAAIKCFYIVQNTYKCYKTYYYIFVSIIFNTIIHLCRVRNCDSDYDV